MNEEIARYTASQVLRMASELTDLVPFLKQFCSEKEYPTYAKAIASVGADINSKILDKIFSKYPHIRKEFDEKIKKYGRIV